MTTRTETAEEEWTAWLGALPELVLPPAGRAVVLAAHPDDETLGAGGTMQRLAASGWDVQVIVATDGEAAYGGDDLGPARIAELRVALARLGVPAPLLLGLPDREVNQHEDELADALPACDLLLAPYSEDGHRDHDACGRVAAKHPATLLEYPIWAWHWSGPDTLPATRAAALTLTDDEWDRKQHALAAYESQDGILPAPVLSHFRRRTEVFLR